MLPLKEKSHELCRRHRLDFFSQSTDGQPMNVSPAAGDDKTRVLRRPTVQSTEFGVLSWVGIVRGGVVLTLRGEKVEL